MAKVKRLGLILILQSEPSYRMLVNTEEESYVGNTI